ncbi:MAG: hypothetical protein JXQ84_04095, partial [Rhodospirillaceae bacterium]|nr:hypothetical protein [Rhodospirillaceae bacterium]
PLIIDMVDQVRQLVNTAASLDDVAEGLLRLRPDLPDAALAQLMGDAMTIAHATGRMEIKGV